jgi:hypothetical protein
VPRRNNKVPNSRRPQLAALDAGPVFGFHSSRFSLRLPQWVPFRSGIEHAGLVAMDRLQHGDASQKQATSRSAACVGSRPPPTLPAWLARPWVQFWRDRRWQPGASSAHRRRAAQSDRRNGGTSLFHARATTVSVGRSRPLQHPFHLGRCKILTFPREAFLMSFEVRNTLPNLFAL